MNFKDARPIKAQLVFCEALRDLTEFRLNAPDLIPFLESGRVLACHDVAKDQSTINELRKFVPIKNGIAINRVFVGYASIASAG
jgi:hypothetical protein